MNEITCILKCRNIACVLCCRCEVDVASSENDIKTDVLHKAHSMFLMLF